MNEELVGLSYGLLFWIGLGALALIVSWIGGALHERRMRRRQRDRLTSDVSRLRGRMTRMAQPTLLLTPASSPGHSKLGGQPDLPAGFEWPHVRGRPSQFLAQLDLGAFRDHVALEWLPGQGRLFFFVDPDGHGFSDQVQVFHCGGTGSTAEAPADVGSFPERRIAFEQYLSRPSLDWMGVDLSEIDVTDDELDQLSALPDEPFGDEIQHRIGGYPSEIQGGQMAVECELIRRGLPGDGATEISPAIQRASKSWRLLLQIDSDPALKMNWGDGGRLYVFVREQDAKAGDFSRTITLSQTD
jgi:uncharacterized protein YwqG